MKTKCNQVVVDLTKTNTKIGRKVTYWFGIFIRIRWKKKNKVASQLAGNPSYFQGKPHVQWYSMNENDLDYAKIVLGLVKVHVLQTLKHIQ
jgi:hypothetical protein